MRDWDKEEKERDRIMRNNSGFSIPNRFIIGFTLGGFTMLGVILLVGWLFNV